MRSRSVRKLWSLLFVLAAFAGARGASADWYTENQYNGVCYYKCCDGDFNCSYSHFGITSCGECNFQDVCAHQGDVGWSYGSPESEGNSALSCQEFSFCVQVNDTNQTREVKCDGSPLPPTPPLNPPNPQWNPPEDNPNTWPSCPYDCQSWDPRLKSCAGAAMNGCGSNDDEGSGSNDNHTCPYDCQDWDPSSQSCVGAAFNGCGSANGGSGVPFQNCPFDCQVWDVGSQSCAGAAVNGCQASDFTSHTCPHSCQVWNPVLQSCVGAAVDGC